MIDSAPSFFKKNSSDHRKPTMQQVFTNPFTDSVAGEWLKFRPKKLVHIRSLLLFCEKRTGELMIAAISNRRNHPKTIMTNLLIISVLANKTRYRLILKVRYKQQPVKGYNMINPIAPKQMKTKFRGLTKDYQILDVKGKEQLTERKV